MQKKSNSVNTSKSKLLRGLWGLRGSFSWTRINNYNRSDRGHEWGREDYCLFPSVYKRALNWYNLHDTMLRIKEAYRRFLNTRSISFRLYLIVIPATILAILLISYVDSRVAATVLENKVRNDTITIAENLAYDLARLQQPLSAEAMHPRLTELVETNPYITRIEVFSFFDGGVTMIDTTSSASPPSYIDEETAIEQGKPLLTQEYQDRRRALKVIIPFRRSGGIVNGCVSITSSLEQSDLVIEVYDRIDLFLIPISVLALVLLLHHLFTRVLTGRIRRLGWAMTQARGGALEKRAQVERRDELGIIAQVFNETMAEIEGASKERDRLLEEQKTFNALLQDKVRDATHELSAANFQLRQANQDLIETQNRLTRYERMAVAGQMAAAFAHEVGSPLSAISTHLELMNEESGCGEEAQRRVRLIQEQVNRITGFVEELLSETRAAVHAISKVQLNDILSQLLLFLAQHLERHQIRIETALHPGLPQIEANPQELQQVFLNLLNNAAEAMPGGGTIRVVTRQERDANERDLVVAAISDTGIGIPPEEQRQIFEPFFTTKELRRGTGLGLSIAARIVRQHAGTIELESTPGAGTTFTIRFPAVRAEAPVPEEVRTA